MTWMLVLIPNEGLIYAAEGLYLNSVQFIALGQISSLRRKQAILIS